MRDAAPLEERKEERAGEEAEATLAEGVWRGVGPGVETVGAVEFVGEWKGLYPERGCCLR
jgi:hypothetical protein